MINPTTLILTLSLCILAFISLTKHRKTNTPCPNSYPLIGNLLSLLRNRWRFHDWVAEMLQSTPSSTLHVKSFLNLSNGICTSNPLNIQHLLLTNFTNYVKGSRFHSVLEELLGNGIFNVDNELWNVQRKIASHEFSTKSLKHFISDTVSSEVSTRLMPFLAYACNDERSVIDLQDVLQKFTFNNICNVAFGVDMQCLDIIGKECSSMMDFVKAFDCAVENCSSRFLCPLPVIWKFKRFFNVGSERKFKDCIKIINSFSMEIIRLKENGVENNNQDLLSRFMNCDIEFQSHEHKRMFLRDILISFILAGKDSTSTALTWFFWLIAGHPKCAALIRAEIMGVQTRGTTGILNYDELKSLHYTHAALSESMRLFPPVPIDSRLAIHDDVLPDGTKVCKGWFADYSAYAVGRNEKVWGSDCREFKPERWLDDERTFKICDSLRFPVFHSGPRICLGKDMAYLQMKCIVAAVMANFEVMPVDGGATAERMMQPPYMLSLLLKMRNGLQVRLNRLQR